MSLHLAQPTVEEHYELGLAESDPLTLTPRLAITPDSPKPLSRFIEVKGNS